MALRYRDLVFKFVIVFALAVGCRPILIAPSLSVEDQQLLLGNPSGATTDLANANNYLLRKPQYALSYSRDRGTPNWVSWHVSPDWLGDAPRQNNFRIDASLPEGWYQVPSGAYTNSGFDRGHNVPSADRTKTPEDNAATFLMTNIIPQAPKNNQETWGNLEEFTRSLVEAGNEVYVVMGSYGMGGGGTNGRTQRIDNGRVTVPARIWKVMVVLPLGDDDLRRINATTRVIAVNTPNANNLNLEWDTYRVSVDAIEKATGYDLLSNLPEKLQQKLEAQVDTAAVR